MVRTAVIILTLLTLVTSARAQETRYALLDLGAGDDAIIGLHITAESLRESVAQVPEDVTALVLRLDSAGGFLAETPALAELLSTELGADRRVILWIDEASSTAALVALSAPTLVMSQDGILRGHEPFERLGDLDLSLTGEALDAAHAVAGRCALLGDRPALVARAFVSPTPLSLDENGALHADSDHQDVISTGTRVLTLDAETALRLAVADATANDEDALETALGLGTRCPCVRAQAVLDVHREQVTERLTTYRASKARLETLLSEAGADEEPASAHDEARRLLGVLDGALRAYPRIGAHLGLDKARIEMYDEQIRRTHRSAR